MNIIHSETLIPSAPSPEIAALCETIQADPLHRWVKRMAVPRHFRAEAEQNKELAKWLTGVFQDLGFQVESQGEYRNIVAYTGRISGEAILVGAHYDSVPLCPGADDNASAVAALLGCASACRQSKTALPLVFVAFNREEDDLLGSRDFVESYLPAAPFRLRCAHILEMVGYASTRPDSQRVPTGLPIQLRSTGDFLGLLSNQQSSEAMQLALRQARTYVPQLLGIGLEIQQGFEKLFPVLARSDHVPFWTQQIAALMWTDTAEFRNPHYHKPSDTPETLDYEFLTGVTQVLSATILAQAARLPAP